jgi:hypothetical protein
MEYLILIVLILLSPAILVGSLVFPVYWILQYRLLRRTGSWILHREFHTRWMKFLIRGITVAYLLCLGGMFLPELFPTVRLFLMSGWMLGVLVPVVADVAILMSCSPDRAVEKWRADQPTR